SNLYTRNLLVGSERFAGLNPAALEVLSGVQPHYIKSTFEEIRKQYGSIDKMLEQELGINAANRKLLIEKYTY
ncbi:MAG: tyrosine-protein phosphatase, partial [Cyclobacteriaceae bacterium]